MTDFRAELQLLFDDAESFAEASLGHHYLWVAALNRAHAALAEQPVGPTDEELIRPIMWMLDDSIYDNDKGEIAQSLRELVARWGQP